MQDRHSRNIPALSQAECLLLKSKKVCVIGCGGLGGHLIEQLSRIGVGNIRCVDGDVFEPSNLNRQLLSSVAALGTSKATAAEQRVHAIDPEIIVESICCFLSTENADELICDCDVVLDALDNIDSRRILANACERAGVPLVHGAISGWIAQAAVSMPGDHLIEKLYPEGSVIRNKSVLAFAPALAASLQTSLCIRLLTGQPIESSVLYYFDMQNMEFETIRL